MTAPAPILHDAVTLPRKPRAEGSRDLVGLGREEMRAALVAAGTP